ncbi:cell division protein ZapD [Oligella ureolytica]
MILYEYPFSEKIRSFLRLEYLFQRLFFFHQNFSVSPEGDESLLGALFDVMDVCERGDARNTLLQELDKQKNTLQEYRNYPDINLSAIDSALIDLNRVSRELHDAGKIGRAARECEWLAKIKNRYVVPGGLSSTEFPAYQAWLIGNQEQRQRVIRPMGRVIQTA